MRTIIQAPKKSEAELKCLVSDIQLAEKSNQLAKTLSGGMKRKVRIPNLQI